MNTRKKFLSMLTAVTMLAGVFCTAAFAEAEDMDVAIASESFPLKIMGKQVTSDNMDNITGDGSKSYSFDGDHTLTISTYPGSGLTETYYGGEEPIIYSELDGLVIKTVNSPIITSTNTAIVLKANTIMTGCSLTIYAAETAVSVENGGKLTIADDSEITVSRSKFGITGLLDGESLEIARSDVNVTSTEKAIGFFDGGITIDDYCEITKPADGYIGKSSIASAGGTNVTEVTITRIVPMRGEMVAADGKRPLSWAFIPTIGEVVVTEGDVSEDTPLLVASYDEKGVCIGVTMMTHESYSTIAVQDGASSIKLLWWDMPGNIMPISDAIGFELFD